MACRPETSLGLLTDHDSHSTNAADTSLHPYHDSAAPVGLERKRPFESGASSNSMLEQLRGVESRVGQPQKRVKKESDNVDAEVKGRSSHSHESNGIVGAYMRPASEAAQAKWPLSSQTVDLTAGELT